MNRTIMIMAGGTGGHIFPALSVADYLRAQGWSVVWLGTRAGMESTLVAPRGYTLAWIAAATAVADCVLAERTRDFHAPPRRRARHGWLRVVPGRHDGIAIESAARDS
jgi:hypothetical protein